MRNAVSILLMLILVILTPVLFIVTSVRLNILTANFIKHELASLDIYGVARTAIDEQINKIKLDPQTPITNAEIVNLAHGVITDTWLRQNLENTLDRTEGWLKAPAGAVLSLTIDLRQPKASLTSGINALLTAKLPTIQPCPDKRRPKANQGVCQFAGLTLAQAKEQLGKANLNPDTISQKLPDQLDLLNPDLSAITGQTNATEANSLTAKTQATKKTLEQIKARYQQVIFLMDMALVIYGLLVTLYLAINASRGWHRLVRWGGVIFFTIGWLPLAIAIASGPLIQKFVIPKIQINKSLSADLTHLVRQLITDTNSALFMFILIISGAMVMVGLAGLVSAHWIKSPPKAIKSPKPATKPAFVRL